MFESFTHKLSDKQDQDQLLQILAFESDPHSHICRRAFLPGDIIFHCKTCAFDDRSIFCRNCFQQDQHKGHNFTFLQAPQPGEHCACGEFEARNFYQHSLPCNHKAKEGFSQVQISQEVLSLLKSTVVDELIGNLACAFDLSQKPSEGSWLVLIYNNQLPPRDQFVGRIEKVIGISQSESESFAVTLVKCGRISVFQSESKELALEKANDLSNDKIPTRVISQEQYDQEELAFKSLQVLTRICEFPHIREFVNQALFSPFASLAGRIDTETLLLKGFSSTRAVSKEELLIFDFFILTLNGLWKEFRESMIRFFLVCPLSDAANYKIQFSKRFALHYLQLYVHYLQETDTEYSIYNFSFQIFSNSHIAEILVKETKLLTVIIDLLFKTFTLTQEDHDTNPFPLTLDSARFFQLFEDLGLLASQESTHNLFTSEMKDQIVQTLCHFEEIYEKHFVIGDPHGSQDGPLFYAFRISHTLAPMIKNISQCFNMKDLPCIMHHYTMIPGIGKRRFAYNYPLPWLVGAIVHREGSPLHSFGKPLSVCLQILMENCIHLQIDMALVEDNTGRPIPPLIFNETAWYHSLQHYKSMFCQEWNLLKFFAQKLPFIRSIATLDLEKAIQLEGLIAIVARLISRSDNNSPRLIMMHSLAQGPAQLSDLIRLHRHVADDNQKEFEKLLRELGDQKADKVYLKPSLFGEIDIFHCSVRGIDSRQKIIHLAKENGINVLLNDIPIEISSCFQTHSQLEEKLASLPEEWLAQCSSSICALAFRIRKKVPNYAQRIVHKLPQGSETVKRAFSLGKALPCCPV